MHAELDKIHEARELGGVVGPMHLLGKVEPTLTEVAQTHLDVAAHAVGPRGLDVTQHLRKHVKMEPLWKAGSYCVTKVSLGAVEVLELHVLAETSREEQHVLQIQALPDHQRHRAVSVRKHPDADPAEVLQHCTEVIHSGAHVTCTNKLRVQIKRRV